MTDKNTKKSYLYHPENKEMYREAALSFIQEDCVRSRHILSYLDMPELSQNDSNFSDHVEECKVCQTRVSQSQNLLKNIENLVELKSMDYWFGIHT